MAIRDILNPSRWVEYFTEDGEEFEAPVVEEQGAVEQQVQPQTAAVREMKPVQPARPTAQAKPQAAQTQRTTTMNTNTENITRLHERQRELSLKNHPDDEKVTIDVRYPRRYEEATEIVDLLLANESVLIDFQYMTEVQARRCLDYLDGARYVLAGNLKKVASTMYLLTPINVVVNIEDLRLPEEVQQNATEYNFDMKRR